MLLKPPFLPGAYDKKIWYMSKSDVQGQILIIQRLTRIAGKMLPALIVDRVCSKLRDVRLLELLKGGGISFSIRIAGLLLGYAFSLLIARKYGAQVMGGFTLFWALINILSITGRLGLDLALMKFTAICSVSGDFNSIRGIYLKCIKMALPSGILFSFALYFTSDFLAVNIFRNASLAQLFRIASLSVTPLILIFINAEGLRGLKRIDAYAFISDGSFPFFGCIFFGLFVAFTQSELVPQVAYTASIFTVLVISFILWLNKIKSLRTTGDNRTEYREILDVAIPLLTSSSVAIIVGWTDRLMLGVFRLESEVGIYNIALKVSALTCFPLVALNSIAAPLFAQFYARGDLIGLKRTAQNSTSMIFWSTMPLALFFCLFPSFLMGIFGSEFKAGTTALLILVAGDTINATIGPVGYIMQMTGKQKTFRNLTLATAAMNIALNLVMIPAYGLNGAAVSRTICLIITNVVSLLLVRHYFGFYTVTPLSIFRFGRGNQTD